MDSMKLDHGTEGAISVDTSIPTDCLPEHAPRQKAI
jgi:hypothetical protein